MDQRRINISEARARLPELARRVAAVPGAVEYIEHRDLDDDLALTTASHIRYLEATVAELRKRASRPFRLAGSMTSALSDEAIEAGLGAARRSHAERAAEKARGLDT